MRVHDGDFDEKEREEGENRGLDEAHKELEHHDGDGRNDRQEKGDDKYQHFTGENVAEKTE